MLGNSPGGSQRGLEASGGALVAGVALTVGWENLCHGLSSVSSLLSLLRRGLCRSRDVVYQ